MEPLLSFENGAFDRMNIFRTAESESVSQADRLEPELRRIDVTIHPDGVRASSYRLIDRRVKRRITYKRRFPKAFFVPGISQHFYVTGGPEWAGEVAASSVSYALHDKKEVYRRNGVCEYFVWRVEDRAIDWFVLRGGDYQQLEPGKDDIFRSEVFPGLWLDANALLAGNVAQVLRVLQDGLATGEHADFVASLAARAGE